MLLRVKRHERVLAMFFYWGRVVDDILRVQSSPDRGGRVVDDILRVQRSPDCGGGEM